MKQKLKKGSILYLCLLIAIGVSGCWGPAWVRSKNLRQAQRELDVVKKELGSDTRFSKLLFLVSTTNLGNDITVEGSVPDQACLDYLKLLFKMEISPKFNVRYSVDIKQDYDKPTKPAKGNKTISSDKDKDKITQTDKGSEVLSVKKETRKSISSEKKAHISKIISEYFKLRFSLDIRGPLTIDEVEKELLDNRLTELKSKYQDDDEIYYFKSDEDSWRGLIGREGYALIRNGQIVYIILTALS